MKEELLKEAMELARKFRKCCEDFENKKANASIECLQDILLELTKCGGEFVGFFRALAQAGIFNKEDCGKIRSIAYPESDSSGLSPQIVDFIKGLKDIDNLG